MYEAEFWVAVAFVIFVGILIYVGVPKMLTNALDDRAKRVRTELDEARRLKEEAQKLLAEYRAKQRQADQEAVAREVLWTVDRQLGAGSRYIEYAAVPVPRTIGRNDLCAVSNRAANGLSAVCGHRSRFQVAPERNKKSFLRCNYAVQTNGDS